MQREKNTQPLPPSPTSGGSSPKWGPQRKTLGNAPAPQNPAAPSLRFTPHECGHNLHESMAADYSIRWYGIAEISVVKEPKTAFAGCDIIMS